MNYLFFSDIHIKKEELKECILILEEIGMLCNKFKIDKVFNLGDTFNKINPESECLDVFSTFINRLNRPITILAANSHESSNYETSVLNHFGILHNNVTIVKEYIDENYLYCGHFILNESKFNYGSKRSKKEFSNYKYVCLGHQHNFQEIPPNTCHIGSCRYIDFAESEDKAKLVLLIENYKEKDEKCHFIKLSSPFSMKQVYLDFSDKITQPGCSVLKSIEKIKAYLDSLDENTKVKVKIGDFELFKQYLAIENDYKSKFTKYLRENCFELNTNLAPIRAKNETINFKEKLHNYLINNKIDEEIANIIEREI